jgi:hypothetical protein
VSADYENIAKIIRKHKKHEKCGKHEKYENSGNAYLA